MIKENQRLLNQLHVISDGVTVFLSMMLAYWVRFSWMDGIESIPFRYYVYLGLIAVGLCLFTFGIMELYRSQRTIRFHREISRLFGALCLDTLLLIAGLYVFHQQHLSRWTLIFFFLISLLLLTLKRAILRTALHRYRKAGYNQKHVILIGCSDSGSAYLSKVQHDRNLGFVVDGYISDRPAWRGLPHLGDYAQLESLLDQYSPDEVVIAIPVEEQTQMPRIIAACEKTGTKASVIPYYAPYIPSNPQIDDLDGLPLINLRHIPLDNIGNAVLKRCTDITISLTLLIVLSPLLLLTAVGVRLSSPGPIIFRQERVGRNKKTFYMYKFRSMRINDSSTTAWSTNSDPRKTKFGAFIRKCSIDELPQLVNVLKGDMSLVGPRPEIPHFVEQFKEEIPRYMVKHRVRPGITGWAQVNGFRGDTSIKARIDHDLYYIENWDFFFDLKILLKTLLCAVNHETLS